MAFGYGVASGIGDPQSMKVKFVDEALHALGHGLEQRVVAPLIASFFQWQLRGLNVGAKPVQYFLDSFILRHRCRSALRLRQSLVQVGTGQHGLCLRLLLLIFYQLLHAGLGGLD